MLSGCICTVCYCSGMPPWDRLPDSLLTKTRKRFKTIQVPPSPSLVPIYAPRKPHDSASGHGGSRERHIQPCPGCPGNTSVQSTPNRSSSGPMSPNGTMDSTAQVKNEDFSLPRTRSTQPSRRALSSASVWASASSPLGHCTGLPTRLGALCLLLPHSTQLPH